MQNVANKLHWRCKISVEKLQNINNRLHWRCKMSGEKLIIKHNALISNSRNQGVES